MRIYRAHSQSSIDIIRKEEKKLPIHIIKLIQHYQLISLPEFLTFSFIGIEVSFTKEQQMGCAGWCDYIFDPKKFSHIFIKEGYEWCFLHEVGHAIDNTLGYPSENLFRPELSLNDYGMTNSHEYFAEAFMQFFDPVDKEKLFKADKNIFYFIRAMIIST